MTSPSRRPVDMLHVSRQHHSTSTQDVPFFFELNTYSRSNVTRNLDSITSYDQRDQADQVDSKKGELRERLDKKRIAATVPPERARFNDAEQNPTGLILTCLCLKPYL